MYQVSSEKFNGPLDLLLRLIEEQKMEITEISIAHVTDEYLQELEKIQDQDPEELSDFLVLAARLLYLKSKALLPYLAEEEEVDDLEKQLKLYKEFVEASKKIASLIKERRFTFSREKAMQQTAAEFSPAKNITLDNLKNSFLIVLRRLDPLVKMPQQMIEKTVSLQKKIFEIKEFLKKQGKFGFRGLIELSKNRTEVIVNFLALLELIKQAHLRAKQNNAFNDIIIEKV